ncbi:hypothetical protein Hanom_Chr01g00036891 [Helianthus anomalus]
MKQMVERGLPEKLVKPIPPSSSISDKQMGSSPPLCVVQIHRRLRHHADSISSLSLEI